MLRHRRPILRNMTRWPRAYALARHPLAASIPRWVSVLRILLAVAAIASGSPIAIFAVVWLFLAQALLHE